MQRSSIYDLSAASGATKGPAWARFFRMTYVASAFFARVCRNVASHLHPIPALLVVLGMALGTRTLSQTAQFSGAQSTIPFPGLESPGLQYAYNIAVDGSGNVYVADYGASLLGPGLVIKETLSAGAYTTSYIGSGLDYPYGVAVDGDGNVYISDTGNSRVLKETLSGGGYTQSVVVDASNGLNNPYGVAVDGSGNVYIADLDNQRVLKETLSGGGYTQSVVADATNNGLSYPVGVSVDNSSNVYIADSGDTTNQVLKETPSSGGYTQSVVADAASNGLNSPNGVAVDGSGNVYIADLGNNRVLKETLSGGTYTQSVVPASGLHEPGGVEVDGNGDVYISDTYTGRVVEETSSGGNFGTVNVAGASANPVSEIFTFDTAGTLGSTAVLTQGAADLDFTDAGTGTCNAGTAYNAGDICTIDVTFRPTAPGTRYGAAELLDGSGSVLATGYVQGAGAGPLANFLPGAQNILGGGFNGPLGVAVDGSGNVYVADTAEGAVKEIPFGCASSTCVTALGGGFFLPYGVAVDGGGNVYVVDSEADGGIGLVNEIPPGCASSSCVRTLDVSVPISVGLAMDGSGNIYAASISGVYEAPPGCGSFACFKALGGGFLDPAGVAVDGSGNVYVADAGNNAVKEMPAGCTSSSCVTTLGGGFNEPHGVAVDGSGNIYVADSLNNAVKRMPAGCSSSNCVTTLDSNIDGPYAVALDANGNVYATNTDTNSGVDELSFATPPSLNFANTNVGLTSSDSPQTVMVENIGNAPLNAVAPGLTAPVDFKQVAGSGIPPDCTSGFSIAPAASCSLSIEFAPTTAGTLSESFVLTDNSLNATAATQSIQLSGIGESSGTTTTSTSLTSSLNPSLYGQSVQITATVAPMSGSAMPTGTVQFSVDGIPAGSPVALSGGSAEYITNSLSLGTHSITAAFTPAIGTGFTGSNATALSQVVDPVPAPTLSSIAIAPVSATILVGQTQQYSAMGTYSDGSTQDLTDLITWNSANPYGCTINASGLATCTGIGISTITASLNGVSSNYANLTSIRTAFTAPTESVGTSSGTETAIIWLPNGFTLGSISVVTQGAPNLDFNLVSGGTCVVGNTYSAGVNCTVNYTFKATAPGIRMGAINLYGNSSPTPVLEGTVFLSGMGTGPLVDFLPGAQSTVVTTGGTVGPIGMAIDGSGNVYIADYSQSQILKETPTAGGYTETVVANAAMNGLNQAMGVAVDGAGNVYVADTFNNRVLKEALSAGGYTQSTVATGLNLPQDMTVDSSGNVYIADTENDRVLKESLSVGGYTQTTMASGQIIPYGVAVDGSGNVYIADWSSSGVLKETLSAGSYIQSTLASGLNAPGRVSIDAAGNVYVSDVYNNRVLKETPSPGGYTQSTIASGQAKPWGIAVDGSGNLFIANYTSKMVVKEDFADAPSLSFASTKEGSTSSDSPQSVTVENNGNATLTAVAPGLTSPTDFTQIAGSGIPVDCTAGFSLAAGSSCNLSIAFTPTTTGTLNEAFVLTDNSLNSTAATQSIQLSGVGELSGTTATTTSVVSSLNPSLYGQAVQFTATVTPASGSAVPTGTVQFSVDGAPAGTPVALNGGSAAYAISTLTAATHSISAAYSPGTGSGFTASSSLTLNQVVNAVEPVIAWATPAAITYGTALSGTQLNASTTVAGTFVYIPAAGTVLGAGSKTLSVTFTPTDGSDYTTAKDTVTLVVNQATPVINWTTPTAITYGTALSGKQLDATAANNGGTVAGTFIFTPAKDTVLTAGTQTLSVTFTPTNTTNYVAPPSASVVLQVNQATPKITWTKPAAIAYGTALSATQLDATASVAGTFVYSPPAGSVLTAGTQTLSVTFTPTDAVDYVTATDSVTITVKEAAPTVTWATPAAITYGTPLSSTQLDATASVPGTFVYSPAAGAIEGGGSDKLSVTFTPTDGTDYITAKASVTLQVNSATPTINWATPAAITYGTALSGTQLEATATNNGTTVGGTFVYSPAKGTVLTAGTQTLSVTFTPANTTNYAAPPSSSVVLQVNQATPKITWTKPAAITYGTALSATQLDATASVAGTFVYSPPAGSVLTAGTQTLSIAFTPTDAVDYVTATDSVSLAVVKATPSILGWPTASAITSGQTLASSTLTDGAASVPGSFGWVAPNTVPPTGTDTESVVFTPLDAVDYNTVTGTVRVNATFAAYSISTGIDSTGRYELWETNPSTGALVNQSSVSLPADGGVYYNIGGLAFANGNLWAISKVIDSSDRNQLWEINPSTGALVKQLLVSLPADGGVYYNVGSLTFANGNLWAISAGIDSLDRHLLWEINPSTGALVKQTFVSLPADGGVYYNVGGLAFASGNLWAISIGIDSTGRYELWEINPSNGALVKETSVSLPADSGAYYNVGGLAFASGDLWAISTGIDSSDRHLLWEIDPSTGDLVKQSFASLPSEYSGVYYNVGGLALQ